jgi:hypothetical protein
LDAVGVDRGEQGGDLLGGEVGGASHHGGEVGGHSALQMALLAAMISAQRMRASGAL